MDELISQLVAAIRAGDVWCVIKTATKLGLDVFDIFHPDHPPLMTGVAGCETVELRMLTDEQLADKLSAVQAIPSDVDAPRADAAPPWLAILTPILLEILRRFTDRFQQV